MATFAQPARAQLPSLRVEPYEGCPSQRAVETELGRLLPIAPPSACCIDIVVQDNGDSFSLQVDGAQRRFPDEARDCRERARMIAVAIAMTLAPPLAAECTADPRAQPQPASPHPVVANPSSPYSVVANPPQLRTPNRRRLILTIDTGATYMNLEGFNLGAFALAIGLGAEFEHWSLQARGTMEVGGSTLVIDGTIGLVAAIKLSSRIRFELGAGVGIGVAQLNYTAPPALGWTPTYPTTTGGLIVSASADVTVDLYTHGRHTVYALIGPEFKAWLLQEGLFAQVPSSGRDISVRLALGYRFLR